MNTLAPWLRQQNVSLLSQQGHAWLLQGPSGLGQYELASAMVGAWLCESSNALTQGACGQCGSCHALSVHTHADLFVLMPETILLELGWPLSEKAQSEIDNKSRKPSKFASMPCETPLNFRKEPMPEGAAKLSWFFQLSA